MTAELTAYLWSAALSNTLVAALLAVLAWAAHRGWRRPALAHGLWVLALCKLVTPPLYTWTLPLPLATPARAPTTAAAPTTPIGLTRILETRTAAAPAPVAAGPLATDPVATDPVATDPLATGPAAAGPVAAQPRPPAPLAAAAGAGLDWSLVGLWVWLLGAGGAGGLGLWRALRFHRGLRHAAPASPPLRAEVGRLARQLGLRRVPAVKVLPGRLSPMLWGCFGRAQVLLPADLHRDLPLRAQRTLLVHELAHLQRRDHWVRLLELAVRTIHWWNPLAHWACRRLRTVEEECCDAWVVWALPDASRHYADALLDTAAFLSESPDSLPVPASGIGTANDMRRRLTMILQRPTDPAGRPQHNHGTLGRAGRLAVLGLAAAVLPLVPALGQDKRAPRERRATEREDRARSERAHRQQVMQALERAIDLLRQNRRGEEAEALLQLARQLREQPPAHLAERARAAEHADQAAHAERRAAHLARQLSEAEEHLRSVRHQLQLAREHGHRDQLTKLLRQAEEIEKHGAELRAAQRELQTHSHEQQQRQFEDRHRQLGEALRAAERRGQADRADALRRQLAELETQAEHRQTERARQAAELQRRRAAEAREQAVRERARRDGDARERRQPPAARRGDGDATRRIRELETRIDRLTEAVERLLRDRQDRTDERAGPRRRDRAPQPTRGAASPRRERRERAPEPAPTPRRTVPSDRSSDRPTDAPPPAPPSAPPVVPPPRTDRPPAAPRPPTASGPRHTGAAAVPPAVRPPRPATAPATVPDRRLH